MKDKIDAITLDVPLMIRLLEFAKEDAKDDMQLHSISEKLIKLSKLNKPLTMKDYDSIIPSQKTKGKSLNESLVIKKMGNNGNENPLFFMSTDGVTVGGLELKKLSEDTYTIIDFMTRGDVNPTQIVIEAIRRIMIKNDHIRVVTIQTNESNESFWAKATNNHQVKNNLYSFSK